MLNRFNEIEKLDLTTEEGLNKRAELQKQLNKERLQDEIAIIQDRKSVV
jgi:hypothetical protein